MIQIDKRDIAALLLIEILSLAAGAVIFTSWAVSNGMVAIIGDPVCEDICGGNSFAVQDGFQIQCYCEEK